MGISRSATVVIAYIMKKFQYNFYQAFDFVKQKRPFIRPNIGFSQQLEVYSGMVNKFIITIYYNFYRKINFY